MIFKYFIVNLRLIQCSISIFTIKPNIKNSWYYFDLNKSNVSNVINSNDI